MHAIKTSSNGDHILAPMAPMAPMAPCYQKWSDCYFSPKIRVRQQLWSVQPSRLAGFMSDRLGFCTPPPRMAREVTAATGVVIVIHVRVHPPTKMQRHRIPVLLVLFVSEREGSHLFCGLVSQPNFVFLSTRPSCETHRCFLHMVLVMGMKYFPRGRRARWQKRLFQNRVFVKLEIPDSGFVKLEIPDSGFVKLEIPDSGFVKYFHILQYTWSAKGVYLHILSQLSQLGYI
jgi:hypothetical protein